MVRYIELSDIDIRNLEVVLSSYSICDICIGRIFSKQQSKIEFKKLGNEIRTNYSSKKETLPHCCVLCDGFVSEEDKIQKLILDEINHYEFSTFIIGFHVDDEILAKEQEIFSLFSNDDHESIKNYLKREIGSSIEKKIAKEVAFEHPDIMIIVNTMFYVVDLQIKSLFIYGRYNKFKRGIPQSKWFCRSCRGVGCRDCKYSGTLYDTSVEEMIASLMKHHAQGTDESFHGSGREDIDVRMLGSGRPFIVEIINPLKRNIDLEKISNEINLKYKDIISVSNLRFSTRYEIQRIKESKFSKVYEVTFEGKFPFDIEKLKKVALSLRGTIIQQFTPTRVARRRANKVRPRQIFECTVVSVKKNKACFRIESASGTYIKELVTGDEGKTEPSISSLIGQPCKVLSLDVMEIKGE